MNCSVGYRLDVGYEVKGSFWKGPVVSGFAMWGVQWFGLEVCLCLHVLREVIPL